jgi:hypothetical protein
MEWRRPAVAGDHNILFERENFGPLNIPAGNRSKGQQRRASSSCLTIQEFDQ